MTAPGDAGRMPAAEERIGPAAFPAITGPDNSNT